jgi:putative PEP-CTERM system TPR-repeat lipoprotein
MMAIVQLIGNQPGARAEVAKLLESAIKAAPNDPMPRLLHIRMLSDGHDLKGALAAAQAAQAVLPDNLEIQAALGREQLLSGAANQAVSTLSKVAVKDSQSAVLQLLLANAYVQTSDLTSAERAYRRALELSPGSEEARRGVISLSVRAKSPARGLEAAQALQRQFPDSGVGHLLEGDLYAQFNNWDEAARAYRAGLAKGPFVGMSERLYSALSKGGKQVDADRFAEEWMKKHPEDAGLPFHLGNRAMAADDLPLAERYFAAAHKSGPRLAGALNNLAWVRAKLGRADAVNLARQAVALAPVDDPAALDTLVFALTQQKQEKEAIDLMKAAVARSPRQASHHFVLARLYADVGDKQAARSQMDKLAEADRAFSQRPEVTALRARISN